MTGQWRDERAATLKNKYSDLTITCGSDTYKVHKAIVCSQSGFFENAERFGGKEATENHVDFPEDDPAIIKLMIQYLYEGEYDPPLPADSWNPLAEEGSQHVIVSKNVEYHYRFPHTCAPECPENYRVCPHHRCSDKTCKEQCNKFICHTCTAPGPPEGDASQLLLHSQLYSIADKYIITSLKTLSQEKFARACRSGWNDDAFISAVEHVLMSTQDHDEGLKKTVREILALEPDMLSKQGIKLVLGEHPSFAYTVMERQAEEVKRLRAAT